MNMLGLAKRVNARILQASTSEVWRNAARTNTVNRWLSFLNLG